MLHSCPFVVVVVVVFLTVPRVEGTGLRITGMYYGTIVKNMKCLPLMCVQRSGLI